MIPQSKGKIFLSEERGLNQLDWFRSYNTFNFGKYYNEYKTPFGDLYVLNEDTLAGGRSLRMTVEEDSSIVLLPVVGAITCKDSSGNTGLLEAGQAQLLKIPKGGSFEITNPYGSDLVKFLQLWIKAPVTSTAPAEQSSSAKESSSSAQSSLVAHSSPAKQSSPAAKSSPAAQSFSFDLSGHKNKLIEIFSPAVGALQHASDLPVGLIGKFAGREEATYQLLNSNGLFAFVIEGAFEVQYRLLNAGDGLALWGLQEVELEALSNDAIILLVEVPVTS